MRAAERKHAQLGNCVEFLLMSALDFLPDADQLSSGSFYLNEDRVGAFREFLETCLRVVQQDPGRCTGFVLGRELGM